MPVFDPPPRPLFLNPPGQLVASILEPGIQGIIEGIVDRPEAAMTDGQAAAIIEALGAVAARYIRVMVRGDRELYEPAVELLTDAAMRRVEILEAERG